MKHTWSLFSTVPHYITFPSLLKETYIYVISFHLNLFKTTKPNLTVLMANTDNLSLACNVIRLMGNLLEKTLFH